MTQLAQWNPSHANFIKFDSPMDDLRNNGTALVLYGEPNKLCYGCHRLTLLKVVGNIRLQFRACEITDGSARVHGEFLKKLRRMYLAIVRYLYSELWIFCRILVLTS